MRADIVHDGDPGMLQPGGDPGLLLESLGDPRIGEPVPQHLDRHRPVELAIDGAPHLAHAASTQQGFQGVASAELKASLHKIHPKLNIVA